MNRSKRPKRWQLDIFMLLMIGLMIGLMRADLPPSWDTAAEIAWSVLTIAGLGMWVHENRAALTYEEQQTRRGRSTRN
jgi:hypothetical protein